MKKKVMLAMVLATMLVIVFIPATSGVDDNHYNANTDAQIEYFTQGYNQILVSVKDRYYFTTGHDIFYMDKEKMEPVLFSTTPKSECITTSLTDSTCEWFHYVASDVLFLSYYDDHLYALQKARLNGEEELKYHVVKISTDDASRQIALTLDVKPTSITIHRGNLYVNQQFKHENYEYEYKLLRYNLDLLAEAPKVLYENISYKGYLTALYPYANSLYFTEHQGDLRIGWKYNLRDHTMDTIYNEQQNTYFSSIQGIYEQQAIYYELTLQSAGNSNETWSASTRVRDTTTEQFINSPLEHSPQLYVQSPTDHYLYDLPLYKWYNQAYDFESKKHITVYDRNHKEVGQVPFLKSLLTEFVMPGDENYMFFYSEKGTERSWYFLDKSTIGQSNAEIQTLLTVPRHYSTQYIKQD